jgi:PAS domain S-box-containing protein
MTRPADRIHPNVASLQASRTSAEPDAHDALRRSEARLRAILDTAFSGMVTFDIDGRIESLSRRAERMFDYAAADLVGRPIGLLLANVAVTAVGPVSGVVSLLGGEHEVRGRRSDGQLFDVEVAVSEVQVGSERFYNLIARDVTEAKRAQERALQAERLAATGEMVAGLAHESRNALQRLQAGLERLRFRLHQQPELADLLNGCQLAVNDLRGLHDQVRTYVAPIALELTSCDLSDLWRRAWDDLCAQRLGRIARLDESVSCRDVHCLADSFRLTQVFRNIFENSLAACPDPCEITLSCAEADWEDSPALRIVIRDNGPGLSPEQRRRIFEPFYTTKTRGTGLGMAIVQRIVAAHGGRISVGSEGPGTEIVIVLPWRRP